MPRTRWLLALTVSLAACSHDPARVDTDLALPDLASPDDLTLPDDLTMPEPDDLSAAEDLTSEIDQAEPTVDLLPEADLLATPDLSPLPCGVSGVVDIANDPNHCGACDHACACGSTVCQKGVCVPSTLSPSLSAPYAITVDSTTVYFSTDTDAKLWTVPTTGGVTVENRSALSAVRDLVVSGNTLYATRQLANVISFGAKDGSGAMASYSGQVERTATGLALDATRLYWTNRGNGSEQGAVRVGPFSNGLTTSNLVPGEQNGAERIAVDGAYAYWTNGSTGVLSRYPLAPTSGSTVTPIATGQKQPHAIAVDATHVYWTNRADGTVRRRAKDGSGAIETLASGQTLPMFLVVDASFVYFSDYGGGAIRRVPLAGATTPTNLAIDLPNPLMLAQDASCLYATVTASNVASAGSVVAVGKQ